MTHVLVPVEDVNDDSFVLVKWVVSNGASVSHGEIIAEVETAKSVFEVEAPEGGYLLHLFAEGASVAFAVPIARLFANQQSLERAREDHRSTQRTSGATSGPKITEKARVLASQNDLDLETVATTLGKRGLLTEKDLIGFLESQHRSDSEPTFDVSALVPVEPGVRRVLLLGAAFGASQIIDILSSDPGQQPVAALDDNRDTWGTAVMGVPVVGGLACLERMYSEDHVDAAIVAIGGSVPVRTRLREECERLGVPLANAIDPTAKIATGVKMGQGNVICAFCHFGVGSIVGDNNFISAYNSIEHHCELGSDIATGPGCMTSGLVKIGDGVRLGTGIFIQPRIEIGKGAQVASGAIIVNSVPPDHAVKTKTVTTSVVPIRRSS